MSRTIRSQIPGAAFHITARTQGKEAWFTPDLRPHIERILMEGVATSDALHLSHAIMPNHFHLVIRQGARPLGWVMMPIMRRIALAVQNRFGVEGHVFGQAFYSGACESPSHLRCSVVYNHLNPVRAKLCATPESYEWTSHTRFLHNNDKTCSIQVLHTLKLFAARPDASRAELRENYLRYVQWRMEKDAADDAGIAFNIPEPPTEAGDLFFSDNFCALPIQTRPKLPDLRDHALNILDSIDENLTLDDMRRRFLPRAFSESRDQLIAGLLQAGYRGKSIADLLRVSDSKVSQIAIRMRYEKGAA